MSILLLAPLALLVQGTHAAPSDDLLNQDLLEELAVRITGDIERLRGESFLRPVKVQASDKGFLIEYAKKRTYQFQSEEEVAAEEALSKYLGLVPVDMDLQEVTFDLLEEQVGGFYDPADEAFFVMEQMTGALLEIVMAHELTHALDDQLFDIDGTLAELISNGDRAWAYHAVVEGSGTLLMELWMADNIQRFDLSELMAAQDLGMGGLDVAPEYVWKPMLGSYSLGKAFLAAGPGSERENLDRTFATPPRSSEQVLHPEKYWGEVDEPLALERDLTVFEGWELLETSTLGELGLAMVVTPEDERARIDPDNPLSVLSIEFTHEAAAGWGGDQVWFYGKDEARFVLLDTLWDTGWDAGEFMQAARRVLPQIEGAAGALSEDRHDHGAELLRGPAPNQVGLAVWSDLRSREVRELLEGLGYRE